MACAVRPRAAVTQRGCASQLYCLHGAGLARLRSFSVTKALGSTDSMMLIDRTMLGFDTQVQAERISGLRIDAYLKEHHCGLLGMADTAVEERPHMALPAHATARSRPRLSSPRSRPN